MLCMLLPVNVSCMLYYEGNPGLQQTHAVDVLPLSEGFVFCKFQLQHFSCYLLLQQDSSGLASEETQAQQLAQTASAWMPENATPAQLCSNVSLDFRSDARIHHPSSMVSPCL